MSHEKTADAVLKEKAEFLFEEAKKNPVLLVVNNHVCLGQWHSGIAKGFLPKSVRVLHLSQALDEAYVRSGLYP